VISKRITQFYYKGDLMGTFLDISAAIAAVALLLIFEELMEIKNIMKNKK